MTVLVYAVDLGTTNLKVVLYDDRLRRLAIASVPALYTRLGARVEFDPDSVFERVLGLIARCAADGTARASQEAVIVITGQAESLVLADDNGTAIRPGISWLDDRATAETVELGERFGADEAFSITGEPFASSTWPAAKLRWLRRHEPETLEAARSVLMIKDYLIGCFTGTAVGELTTRGFTYLWDVQGGGYWTEMLEHCGVSGKLPEVVPAGVDLGLVASGVAERLPKAQGYRINAGALDHFCAMVGTGSYVSGKVSESAGTVLSLSMLAQDWEFDPNRKVSFHPGLHDGEIILFNGADSGGSALEWFRIHGLGAMPYADLEAELGSREHTEPPLFLPYLTGINPPDFFPHAKGAFLELDLSHDRIDMAYAVEEGIGHLLRRNLDYIAAGAVREVVSTGGGGASPFWNQLKADICGVDVLVPEELEATCRGAAVLALVAAGQLNHLEDATQLNAPASKRYRPSGSKKRQERYERFENYLNRLFRG
ncbi:MAG: hypothetical protein B5766_02450 [Candidatus Lumbricidophila eiseniae]|uniref:Carbohydrate kinase n=1 Tax=Candidatus Lumbricidiphila eiseniae TaxID=1969409 RepID=A0A2A6FT42_9MICO|nr:MAG: hypothetical protein B5766_02450 [Candidatus Lumbricidophila eiseniae]